MKNIILITQARIGSTRLPSKVLKSLGKINLLELHLSRLVKSNLVSKFIIATTFEYDSHKIIEIGKKYKFDIYQGSTTNVLDRFYKASIQIEPDYIVRVTSDCPLIDATIIDNAIIKIIKEKKDYIVTSKKIPDGFDVEVFKYSLLRKAWKYATLDSEKEHVTPWIRNFCVDKHTYLEYDIDNDRFKDVRLSVDENNDFKAIETLVDNLGFEESWNVYSSFVIDNPQLFFNQKTKRNEGYLKSLQNDKT